MQTNNQKMSSCQYDEFNKKTELIIKINSKIAVAIKNVYKIAEEIAPNRKVVFTFANRCCKGKSYLLLTTFKLLFEEDLSFLSRLVRSKHILEDLNINYYYFY